jgi:phosphatidylglycerol---prolipoprotein diacylglyceryl transferase
MTLALVVFVLVRLLIPKPKEVTSLPWKTKLILAFAAFVGGTLAAKLPFVFTTTTSVFDRETWLADGKTITTALAGAYLSVEVAKMILGVAVKTGDTFALPMAFALAVGRWGCFFNGCCYGQETTLPWGVDFGDGKLRHPTQIYESIFHLAMAAVLAWVMATDALRWQRLKLYLIGYGVYRFATEFIRPEPEWWLGLTFYQWIALGIIVMLSVQWEIDRRALRRLPRAPIPTPPHGVGASEIG